ncbi:hypothetical protein [Pseudomonas aeruginosa]|uniref:hypothetical protein n=1 Tax=Pseudomonas aeruginosa TaxID=287 RepID=UPI00053CF5CC|nr:hypothetical protein [Pseudomonas aeruginosa]MCT0357411.1 hypothetical protein [Pseudomonas aeruginosa]MCT0385518.1 hypothetical protein [Pseudomonas aeruginosa]MDI4136674.1 hypothetical protein [Pseudomonas aeruginosa]PBW68926.1 hypothetical protein CJU04_09690 [Pseudomonas aeruginosa]PNU10243.1 hypothetical protein C2M06_18975 [Pseudomonas aeruginosa]
MAKKYAHIKNPLTVIAIFATFVELGGTIVLPNLEGEVQERYVWFLMGFPVLLVWLFFRVLWHKHEVLYAPRDYRDDNTFLSARGIVPVSQDLALDKLIEEVDEVRADTDSEPVEDTSSGGLETDIPTPKIDCGSSTPTDNGVQQRPQLDTTEQEAGHELQAEFKRAVQFRYKQVNDAFDLLSREKKTLFQRGVSLDSSSYVFSGASITAKETLLVEAFTPLQIMNRKNLKKVKDVVRQYFVNYHHGSDEVRFKFIVLVIDSGRAALLDKCITILKQELWDYDVPNEVYVVNNTKSIVKI